MLVFYWYVQPLEQKTIRRTLYCLNVISDLSNICLMLRAACSLATVLQSSTCWRRKIVAITRRARSIATKESLIRIEATERKRKLPSSLRAFSYSSNIALHVQSTFCLSGVIKFIMSHMNRKIDLVWRSWRHCLTIRYIPTHKCQQWLYLTWRKLSY